jgi:hypothetical protein
MITLGFISLALSIACYSVSQLQQHGKLRWMRRNDLLYMFDFWGSESWVRKYKTFRVEGVDAPVEAEQNWYTRLFKIKYTERWPTSTWLTVAFTDGYHLMQFFFLLFLSLSVALFIGFNWLLLLGVWSGIHTIHALVYKLLSRQ